MNARRFRWIPAWQSYVPEGQDVPPLGAGPLAPEVEAPRELWPAHCDYCAIARTHASNCFCGNCGIAAQHQHDLAKADRLGALGMGW